jgi:HD-GYP domain-containing protein (c-di-GMP phosphodiesterase class II)
MKEIPVPQLTANTWFDQPVYLDEKYILTSPDTPLTSELIDRLRRWSYETVHSDGGLQDAPSYSNPAGEETAPAATLDRDIKEKKRLEVSRKFYFTTWSFVTDRFKRFHDSNKLDLSELTDRVKEMIQMVKTNRDFLLRLKEFEHPTDNYLPHHSLNSTLLALAVGDSLKLPSHRLIELGIASLLHDIGMVKIPEFLYVNPKALTPQEQKMIRAHTILGYKILKGFSLPESVALPALEHHERLNGSGYPQSLPDERISLYAKIVAITCSYDAMVSPRPFKRSLSGHQALLELLKGSRLLYDERAIRTLIFCLSLYPLGSLVLLSNHALARVVRSNAENPKYPTVQVLVDPNGRKVTEQVFVQTSEKDGVIIQRDADPDEVTAAE